MGLEPRKEKRYTYADDLQWPDHTRYELIDGEVFRLAPTPLIEHQEVAGEVYCQLRNQLDGKACRPYIAPVDVRLPRADEADAAIDTVVQPDVLVVCDPAKIDRRGVRGAPDWLLEVLSPAPPPTTRSPSAAPTSAPGCASTGWCIRAIAPSPSMCSKAANTAVRRSTN